MKRVVRGKGGWERPSRQDRKSHPGRMINEEWTDRPTDQTTKQQTKQQDEFCPKGPYPGEAPAPWTVNKNMKAPHQPGKDCVRLGLVRAPVLSLPAPPAKPYSIRSFINFVSL